MSNNDTGFIKFLILLLVLGLTSGLSACQKQQSQIYHDNEADSILGGKQVSASSIFSQRVIYLTIGTSKKSSLCTASALTPNILLTAAHCVKGFASSQIKAVLSANPRDQNLSSSEQIQIEKIIIHEQYRDETKQRGVLHHDLALLKLAKPIAAQRVSRLAQAEQTSAFLNLVSIGYGKKTALFDPSPESIAMDKESPQLYFVMKTVTGYKKESETFNINQNDMTGVCSGDSGGPGFIYDEEASDFFIVGVTSYISVTKAEKEQFDPDEIYDKCIGHGYYSNVTFYRDWIESNISGL
ncbi:MAG: trypsin-like serine protease [Bdellovibrio sp.]|nr:trypsin-like serine protease [Bdellovibrio sp.]